MFMFTQGFESTSISAHTGVKWGWGFRKNCCCRSRGFTASAIRWYKRQRQPVDAKHSSGMALSNAGGEMTAQVAPVSVLRCERCDYYGWPLASNRDRVFGFFGWHPSKCVQWIQRKFLGKKYASTGVVPKIGEHPKMIIFSRKTHGCWVPPFSIWFHMNILHLGLDAENPGSQCWGVFPGSAKHTCVHYWGPVSSLVPSCTSDNDNVKKCEWIGRVLFMNREEDMP